MGDHVTKGRSCGGIITRKRKVKEDEVKKTKRKGKEGEKERGKEEVWE
jgi:hypothetical protein